MSGQPANEYTVALEEQLRLGRWIKEGRFRGLIHMLYSEESADDVYGVIEEAVESGEPYYWSAEMCSMLQSIATRMPEWTLRMDDLPTEGAFNWFAEWLQQPVRDLEQEEILPIRAMTWTAAESVRGKGVAVTLWMEMGPPAQFPMAHLSPFETALWWEGESYEEARSRTGERSRHEYALRFLAAAFALLNQRILTAAKAPVARATRRRLERERSTHEPVVRIVELRRREYAAKDAERAERDPVEWTCQWLVSGHWRRQYHPSQKEHRPIWIAPYTKDPQDKPLKQPKTTVFAVVR